MNNEMTFLIAVGGFLLAHREQTHYFGLPRDDSDENCAYNKHMWFIWITMAGIFSVVSAYLLAKLFLTL